MSAASPNDVFVTGARLVILDDARDTMRARFTSTETRLEPPT